MRKEIMKENNKVDVKKLTGMAMFTALALAATLATKWLQVAFLTFDAKDAVITVAAYIYGPIPGVVMALLTSVIETVTFGGDTGWYGLLMNFLSSATFSLIASLIYRIKRDINGALIGLFSATAGVTGVMLLLNIFVTPLYFGLPIFDPFVMDLLPTLLLPFNFAKALMNSAIAMFLYKPVVAALRKARLVPAGKGKSLEFNRSSVIIIIAGSIGLAASITIFIFIM